MNLFLNTISILWLTSLVNAGVTNSTSTVYSLTTKTSTSVSTDLVVITVPYTVTVNGPSPVEAAASASAPKQDSSISSSKQVVQSSSSVTKSTSSPVAVSLEEAVKAVSYETTKVISTEIVEETVSSTKIVSFTTKIGNYNKTVTSISYVPVSTVSNTTTITKALTNSKVNKAVHHNGTTTLAKPKSTHSHTNKTTTTSHHNSTTTHHHNSTSIAPKTTSKSSSKSSITSTASSKSSTTDKTTSSSKSSSSTKVSNSVVNKAVASTKIGNGVLPTPVLGYSPPNKDTVDTKKEGQDLLSLMWTNFWKNNELITSYKCSDSDSSNQAVVWNLAVVLQAYVDGEAISKGTYTDKIKTLYTFLMKFYNPSKKACSATPGGTDFYTDDNAQVATALLNAYKLNNEKDYLTTATSIVGYIMDSWNNKYGGVTWETDHPYVATISTTEAAVSSMKLYQINKDDKYLKFAEKAMQWCYDHVWDKETNLLKDGEQDGKVSGGPLSYHVGTALSACSFIYEATKDNKWKNLADKLADAGTNVNEAIFNRDYPNQWRFWADPFKWSSLLQQGLIDYYEVIDKESKVINEAAREARFVYDWARSDVTGLFFESINPLSNDNTLGKAWQKVAHTGKSIGVSADNFCGKDENKAPKTSSMAAAGAARFFLLLAPHVDKI